MTYQMNSSREEFSPQDYLETAQTAITLEIKFDLILRELRRIGQIPLEAEPALVTDPLLQIVERAITDRMRRVKHFPAGLFSEPAWDILLTLFRAELTGIRKSITSICKAIPVPPATVLRWINSLEEEELLRREPDQFDRRRVFLSLGDRGSKAMVQYFSTPSSTSVQ